MDAIHTSVISVVSDIKDRFSVHVELRSKIKMTKVTFCTAGLLLMINCYYYANALPVVKVAPGVSSKKTESNGLILPATGTFKPITALTTTVYLKQPYSVFVHYQITMGTVKDFYSKLQINYANAGSLVHSENQRYKTATGYYMANLN